MTPLPVENCDLETENHIFLYDVTSGEIFNPEATFSRKTSLPAES